MNHEMIQGIATDDRDLQTRQAAGMSAGDKIGEHVSRWWCNSDRKKKKHKKSGVSLTHGKRGAIEDLVGEEKPIEHYVSRSQSSVRGNQNLPGLLHTGPVLGNGKGEKADSVPISRGQTASIT